jgi:hypothetical protein
MPLLKILFPSQHGFHHHLSLSLTSINTEDSYIYHPLTVSIHFLFSSHRPFFLQPSAALPNNILMLATSLIKSGAALLVVALTSTESLAAFISPEAPACQTYSGIGGPNRNVLNIGLAGTYTSNQGYSAKWYAGQPQGDVILLTAGQSTLGRYGMSLASSTVMSIGVSNDFKNPQQVYRYILHPGATCKATIPTPPSSSPFKKIWWES